MQILIRTCPNVLPVRLLYELTQFSPSVLAMIVPMLIAIPLSPESPE